MCSGMNGIPIPVGFPSESHENINMSKMGMEIIIIIIKFFNKKVVKRNFTNYKENGVKIIVNNNVYTKLLSRNVVRSDR